MDIAKASGVSKTTVSRYLNGRYDLMSADTRERIKNVIDLSNYRPSPIAQSLKSRRTLQVGVVIGDLGSPFSNAILVGVSTVLDKAGYIPFVVNTSDQLQREERMLSELVERGVDGLLVNTAAYNNPYLVQLDNCGVPVVLCDRYVHDHNFAIVTNQAKEPVYELIYHIYRQGFAPPHLFIEPCIQNSTRMRRRNAFVESLLEVYQIADAEKQVVEIDTTWLDKTIRRLKEIKRSTPKGFVPAVMGGNTITTLHLLTAINELGYRIPHDIGICGPDDWQCDTQFKWSTLISPGITTYAIDALHMGKLAAELLVHRLEDPSFPKQEIVLPTQVVIRGSTKYEGLWNHGLHLT